MTEIPEDTRCARCRLHPATITWAPNGLFDVTHGTGQPWCACCALGEQILRAEETAASLTGLRDDLARACAGQRQPDPAVLIRENDKLRRKLEQQWLMAHYETCGRRYPDGGHAMNYAAPHPEGEWCYWPKPVILDES